MKHTLILLLATSMFCRTASAQRTKPTNSSKFETSVDESQSKTSLTIGTGINSNVGMFGLQLEQKLSPNFSIYTGAGLGTWGYKLTMGGRYYFNGPIGSAVGFSFSNATGAKAVTTQLTVIEKGTETKKDVTFNALSANVINLSWLRYWQMGKRHRFNLELGYSIPLSAATSNYELIPSTVVLTDQSKAALATIQPGGLIIAVGFNFGL